MAQSKDILDLLDLLDATGLDIGFLWGFIHDESFGTSGQLSEFSHPEDAKAVKEVRDRLGALVKSKQGVVSGRADRLIQELLSVVEDGHLDETVTRLELLRVPGIVARWKKLRTISVVTQPDKKVTGYLHQAINCYLYGLHDAAAVLCRAVLESTLVDALGKRGGMWLQDAVSKVDPKDSIEKLINFSRNARILSSELTKKAHAIRILGNDSIHQRPCTEPKTLNSIRDTAEILRHIYGRTGTSPS